MLVYGTDYKVMNVIPEMDQNQVVCLLQRPNGRKTYTSTFKAGKFSKPLLVS